jgi:hypothetical protein
MSQSFQKYGAALLFVAVFVLVVPVFSQNNNVSEVQKTANELFEQKKYSEAKELYSQLVSLYPKDENFNYRFGACLLFVDVDKTYPLKFLEYAVSKPNVEPEAFYFLGKGYHYNYRFDEAIVYFKKYKSKLELKEKSKYPVDHDIRYCENGKSLLINITNPQVISRRKVSAADFFTSFKLTQMGGRMLYAPKELHTSMDKKKGYLPVMYKNTNSNYIYYSSYGNTDKNGLDIFRVYVSDNGVIGKPVRLPETINTEFDERFPFLTLDKNVFYFSSSGHNSMGGADIYSASYDTSSNTYSQITNLDYSVNTPDDDFMYAEVGNGKAYFASNRNSEKGKAYVYEINAQRKAYDIAVLAGTFDSKDTRSCKVTVEDLDEHMMVGTFNTDKKSGDYVMRLKNGGRYSFLVEPYGSQTAYKGRVDLPVQENIKLLKQEIEIVYEGDKEKLVIRNLFEEDVKPEDEIIIAQVLVDNANIEEQQEPEITISSDEMVLEIEEVLKQQELSILELQSKKDASYVLANQKRELAHKDLELADQLEEQISLNDQSSENLAKQKEFAELVQDAKIHSQEAEIAYHMGEKYVNEISKAQTGINETEVLLVKMKEASSTNQDAKATGLYVAFNNDVPESNNRGYENQLDDEIEEEKIRMNSSLKRAESIDREQLNLKTEIQTKKAELLATKKKKEKEEIQLQITGLQSDLEPLEGKKAENLEAAANTEKHINELNTEKSLLDELGEVSDSEINEIAQDEKLAMLASIEATSQEIEALESVSYDYVDNENTSENLDSEDLAKNVVNDSSSTNNQVDPADLIDGEANNESVNIEADNTNVELDQTELVASAINDNRDEASAEIGQNSVQNNANKETIASNEEGEYFDYSSGYEEPVDNIVLVEGESIPLDITSNTGKLKYTAEELSEAEVILDKSEYNLEFQNQYSDSKEITDNRAKARETQRINYNWIVAIEKEVAQLEYAKTQNTNPSYNSNIDGKITELNDQASQKRNFMALNAKIIKQLDEQEAQIEEEIAQETANENVSDEVGVSDLNAELNSESTGATVLETENSNTETLSADISSETNQVSEPSETSKSDAEAIVAENNTELALESSIDSSKIVETDTDVSNVENGSGDEIGKDNSQNQTSNSSNQLVSESDNGAELETPEITNNNSLEELTAIEEAKLSPSAVAIANVEIQTEKQKEVIGLRNTELEELQTQLNNTRKKKKTKLLASQIEVKEAEVAYENKKLQLVELKKADMEKSQEAMISDPLSTRPSETKYGEIRKIKSHTADLQMQLDEAQINLEATKKKKKRRVLEAEIVNIKKDLALAQMESEMAVESVKEMETVEEETLKKLTPYGTQELVKIPELETELTSSQLKEVEALEVYVDYVETRKESELQIQEAAVLYQSNEEKRIEVARMEEEISILSEGLQLLPEEEKDSLGVVIKNKRDQQKRILAEATVVYKEAKLLENTAYFNLNEANSKMLTLDNAEERTLVFAALNGNVADPVIQFDSANINAIPAKLSNDIFVDNDSTFYNDSKPIPVGVSLPSGVILKVQIGAFRNAINQTTFKGFAPIVGERTSSGLTRYTAGLFKDFETADEAKIAIRAKGILFPL